MGLFSWFGNLFGGGQQSQSDSDSKEPVNYKPGGTLMFMASNNFKPGEKRHHHDDHKHDQDQGQQQQQPPAGPPAS